MKRIIPILAALCLVVSMAVPVFAADSDSIVGLWVLNDILVPIDYGSSSDSFYLSCDVTFADDSVISYNVVQTYTNVDITGREHYLNFYFYDYDLNETVDPGFGPLYIYETQTWSQDHRPVSLYVTKDSSNVYLREWLSANANFTPPPQMGLVEVMTDLKEQNQLSQVLTQVVMMIPIGLGCWVGYKGLRKAWDLLHRTLHQA